jgi:hypothetical protein
MENRCGSFYPHRHSWGPARIVMAVVAGVIIASFFALAFGWLVMLLWNWLMPMLFGLKAITYWQAFGIVVLCKLLFGNHGCHAGHHRKHFEKFHRNHGGGEDECFSPFGNRHNWIHYRRYWRERGQKDFESYLKDIGKGETGRDEEPPRN